MLIFDTFTLCSSPVVCFTQSLEQYKDSFSRSSKMLQLTPTWWLHYVRMEPRRQQYDRQADRHDVHRKRISFNKWFRRVVKQHRYASTTAFVRSSAAHTLISANVAPQHHLVYWPKDQQTTNTNLKKWRENQSKIATLRATCKQSRQQRNWWQLLLATLNLSFKLGIPRLLSGCWP